MNLESPYVTNVNKSTENAANRVFIPKNFVLVLCRRHLKLKLNKEENTVEGSSWCPKYLFSGTIQLSIFY